MTQGNKQFCRSYSHSQVTGKNKANLQYTAIYTTYINEFTSYWRNKIYTDMYNIIYNIAIYINYTFNSEYAVLPSSGFVILIIIGKYSVYTY